MPQAATCAICRGSGWQIVDGAEGTHASRCVCFRAGDRERKLGHAGIAPGFRHCDLASFEVHHKAHERARSKAREFVDTYPLTGPTGLLFHGPAGTGKTHLASAIVSELVLKKNVKALFLDFRHLLKTIQESYNVISETSERQVLARILEPPLLALDDLGAEKPSAWVRETVAYVINERYTRGLPILITTNLLYAPAESGREQNRLEMARRHGKENERQVEYLEDRVGVPTLSRLCEMCRPIELAGAPDYRRTVKIFGAEKFHLG